MGKETTRHDENLGAVIYNSAPLFMILVFGAFSNVLLFVYAYLFHAKCPRQVTMSVSVRYERL